jgi:hypothetical protein
VIVIVLRQLQINRGAIARHIELPDPRAHGYIRIKCTRVDRQPNRLLSSLRTTRTSPTFTSITSVPFAGRLLLITNRFGFGNRASAAQ